jgi:hypothetical protein
VNKILKFENLIQNKRNDSNFTANELILGIGNELKSILMMELILLNESSIKCTEAWQDDGSVAYVDFYFCLNTESQNESDHEILKTDFIPVESINFEIGDSKDWIICEFEVNLDLIEYDIQQDYNFYKTYTQYVFAILNGERKGHLNISSNFKFQDYLFREIDITDLTDGALNGLKINIRPNKEKIKKLLKEKQYTFGDLDFENKKVIVESLIETIKKPENSSNWGHNLGLSLELSKLIQAHPKTPKNLRELIMFEVN